MSEIRAEDDDGGTVKARHGGRASFIWSTSVRRLAGPFARASSGTMRRDEASNPTAISFRCLAMIEPKVVRKETPCPRAAG
jgi:hypothetical protein